MKLSLSEFFRFPGALIPDRLRDLCSLFGSGYPESQSSPIPCLERKLRALVPLLMFIPCRPLSSGYARQSRAQVAGGSVIDCLSISIQCPKLTAVRVQKGIAITVLVSVFMLLSATSGRSGDANSALVPFNLVPESDITVMGGEAVQWKLLWNAARKLARAGDYSGAIVKYESLLAQKGNLQEARWELARIHMHLEHWDKAATILELLIESDPDRGAYLDGLGRVMWEKGSYDRAVDLFRRAYEQDQTDQTALAGLVEGLLKLDKKEESLPYLEQLHRLQPDNIGIHRYLAMLTYDLGYYKKARPLLAELAEMKDVDQEVLIRAAKVHDALGLANIAARYWQRIVDREPDNSMAQSRLADIFENGGQLRKALPHLLFLVKHDPADARLLARIGHVYDRIGQPGKALTFYERYLKLHPDDPTILRAVVKIEAALGNKDATLSALENYFQVEPESGPADLKLAVRLYDAAGRFHKAIPLYRKLLALSPDDPDLLAALANDLLAIGENEGALSMWKRLAGIVDDPLTVYRPMADLLVRLGRNRELTEVLEKIHELNKQDLQTTMKLANLYLDQGRLDEAKGLFMELAEAGYQGADFLLGRGRLYDLIGKPEHALHDYGAYLAIGPDRQDIRVRAALLAGELGLYTKAMQQLDAIGGKTTGNKNATGFSERDFARAKVLETSGFCQEAVEIYRALISADNGTEEKDRALKIRAWLALAETYRSADLPFEEEQVLREALTIGYGRSRFIAALFESALRNKRLDDAEAWLADLRKQPAGRTASAGGQMSSWRLRLCEARLLASRGAYRAAIKKGRLLFAEFSAAGRSSDPGVREQHPRLRIGLALGRFVLASGKLNQHNIAR
jgi:tetratricopeptide (TPR) repeat protein